jgi:NAD(P)H-flavin reductase
MAPILDQTAAVAPAADPMQPRSYHVQRLRNDTHDTFTLELAPTDGADGFSFEPGQFNMLYVFGVGEIPISISGDPAESRVLLHTTREVGTVTKAMRKLHRGDTLGVRGPFGTHWPVDDAAGSDVVIVAGGIGLAPLRPALYRLMAERDRFGRVLLLYGARTPADLLYQGELKKWRANFDMEIHVTVDRAMEGWRGNVGVVTTLIARAPFDRTNTVAMICGPELMMKFTIEELLRRGVPAPRIFLSMERNMKCGIGFCGHCQCGPHFVCRDGPVFRYDRIRDFLNIREV